MVSSHSWHASNEHLQLPRGVPYLYSMLVSAAPGSASGQQMDNKTYIQIRSWLNVNSLSPQMRGQAAGHSEVGLYANAFDTKR